MNIIYLILLCQYVFVEGGSNWMDYFKRQTTCYVTRDKLFVTAAENFILPLDDMKLEIKRKGISYSNIHLKQANRVLANRHLPVWIIKGVVDKDYTFDVEGIELQQNYQVMKELGDFTFYQEAETSSAAVYFHNRRELDGMIGYEYVVRRLPIDIFEKGDEIPTDDLIHQFGITRRPFYTKYISRDKNLVEDPNSGVNDQEQMKTYGNRLYDGYPEILVIVSWDLAENWINDAGVFDWYATIVSHVLTIFNGVDMLYSKLRTTNIQINIAGIIIGKSRESFRFLEECFLAGQDVMSSHRLLDAECVKENIIRYLESRRRKIPIDSYDIAIFLTEQRLFVVQPDDNFVKDKANFASLVLGISGCVNKSYQCRKNNMRYILTGIISTAAYLDSYPTITHEIAHLMTVYHDKLPFVTDTNDCCGNIMKTSGLWCDRCISWSEDSEKTLRLFFSSPNCCAFINKPRSLNPPRQQVLLTADEQCQCYGYKSARKSRQYLQGFCRSNLHCITEDDDFVEEPIPMDGTPCGTQKVCRRRKCSKINNHEYAGTSSRAAHRRKKVHRFFTFI